jgi:transcriptional regulator with XRE-family HTH domain
MTHLASPDDASNIVAPEDDPPSQKPLHGPTRLPHRHPRLQHPALEKNRVRPRSDTLQKIAAALEVPIEDLVSPETSDYNSVSALRSELQALRHVSAQDRGDTLLRASASLEPQGLREDAIVPLATNEPDLFESSAQLSDPDEDESVRIHRVLSRIMRNPDLRDLREALAALPARISRDEIRQLAALIDAFIRNRPRQP